MPIRLRVTDLDAWVRFIEPERPEFEISLETFLAQMRREEPPTLDMQAGAAFHAMLEHATVGELDGLIEPLVCESFRFQFDGDWTLALPVCREWSVEKVIPTPSGDVLLRGRLDGHDGEADGEIIDYKLTFSGFDAERYADSLQWKAYCDITGARKFRYLVFEAKRRDNNVWIYGMHELVMFTYPEIGADVQRRVAELAEFVVQYVPSLIVEEAAV